MIPKPFEQISKEDIDRLIAEETPESRTIEYKRDFPGGKDSDTVPLLATICSFANTMGGDFILGVLEENGIATGINGLDINPDDEVLRLEKLIRYGIEPRLQSVNVKPIPVGEGKSIILIRVKQSWNAPHRVTKNSTFYRRSSRGKDPMDITEIRNAFDLSSNTVERIRAFRKERVAKLVKNDELPVNIDDGGILALHLVPLASVGSPNTIDIDTIYRPINAGQYTYRIDPFGFSVGGIGYQVNLDGIISIHRNPNSPSYRCYSQVFRNGMIEGVNILQSNHTIPSVSVENDVTSYVSMICSFLKNMEIEPPVIVFLSLARVHGYSLGVSHNIFDRGQPLNRDIVEFPEIMIDEYADSYHQQLEPLFRMLWNAFGLVREPRNPSM